MDGTKDGRANPRGSRPRLTSFANCALLGLGLVLPGLPLGATQVAPTAGPPVAAAQEAFLKASNTRAFDQFGSAVAVDGDTVAVGAPEEDSNATDVNGDEDNDLSPTSGAVYVFVFDGSTWSQQAYIKASNTGDTDFFGQAVALSGDTLVVGAPFESSPSMGVNGGQGDGAFRTGAAYVFTRSGTTWTQQAYLKASNSQGFDEFGTSVAVSGDTVVVGAPSEDSAATTVNGDEADEMASGAGAAYVFTRSGTTWTQQAYVKASNTGGGDQFGRSTSIDGDTLVVGAIGERSNGTGVDGDEDNDSFSNAGAAYVFTRSGLTWTQAAYLKASNTGSNDSFGTSVSVSGDMVVVGAPFEDSNATGVDGDESNEDSSNAGAAYVFTRSGMTWNQQSYVKASNTGDGDQFGTSLAVSADVLVVGAPFEASLSPGVGGDQQDDGATAAGAAYVFSRNGSTLTQEAYLKASNPDGGDRFGGTLGVSRATVVVGAPREASLATGVDPDGSMDGASQAGAGYVFRLPDCDFDGTPDASELDCDGDGLPDDCEGGPDVNQDGIPDDCQAVEFCFGIACPCGNDDFGGGCRNSNGRGARLTCPPSYQPGSGPLPLTVIDCPPNNLALVVASDVLQTTTLMEDGRMCLAGPSSFAFRYVPISSDAAGMLSLADATAQPPSRSFVVGQSYYFQVWYRDVFCTQEPVPCPSPCGTSTNFTNVAGVVIVP